MYWFEAFWQVTILVYRNGNTLSSNIICFANDDYLCIKLSYIHNNIEGVSIKTEPIQIFETTVIVRIRRTARSRTCNNKPTNSHTSRIGTVAVTYKHTYTQELAHSDRVGYCFEFSALIKSVPSRRVSQPRAASSV